MSRCGYHMLSLPILVGTAVSLFVWHGVTLAVAESVSLAGTNLPVDKIEPLDGELVAIEIDGQKFVSSKESAARSVGRIYARKPELARSLPWSTYGTLISGLAAERDGELVALAITGILQSRELSGKEVAEFLKILSASYLGRQALAEELLRIDRREAYQEESVCVALGFIPHDKRVGIRARIRTDLSWIKGICPPHLAARARRVLGEEGIRESSALLEAMIDLFDKDNEIIRASKTSLERFKNIEDAVQGSDPEKLTAALRTAKFDPNIQDGYAKLQSRAVLEFAQRALVNEQPGVALRGLTALDFSNRNSSHHELVSKALQRLSMRDVAVMVRPDVQKTLAAYAAKDEVVKSQSLAVLSSLIRDGATVARGREVAELLVVVQELRPDPSRENDELRMHLAEAALNQGDSALAERLLAGVQTTTPLWLRIALFTKRLPYLSFTIAVMVSVLIWAVALARYRRGRGHGDKNRSKEDPSVGEDAGAEGEQVASEGTLKGHGLEGVSYTDYDEYGECLKKFHLKKDASLGGIKMAYRNAVKSCHPDLNPNATAADTERFIELTKFYERLLVLHEEHHKSSAPR